MRTHVKRIGCLIPIVFALTACGTWEQIKEEICNPQTLTLNCAQVASAQWYAATETNPTDKVWCVWGVDGNGKWYCWTEVDGRYVDNWDLTMNLWVIKPSDLERFGPYKKGTPQTVAGMTAMFPHNVSANSFDLWLDESETLYAVCRHVAPQQWYAAAAKYGKDNCRLVLGEAPNGDKHMWVEVEYNGHRRYLNNYWVQSPLWTGKHPRQLRFHEQGRGKPWQIPAKQWATLPRTPNADKYYLRWSRGVK